MERDFDVLMTNPSTGQLFHVEFFVKDEMEAMLAAWEYSLAKWKVCATIEYIM